MRKLNLIKSAVIIALGAANVMLVRNSQQWRKQAYQWQDISHKFELECQKAQTNAFNAIATANRSQAIAAEAFRERDWVIKETGYRP